jgi:AraC-like DNA-binding protein
MRDPIPIYVHLRRAKDLIDRDFAETLDVPALAQEAHSSRAHFVRSFKKAFGETPHRYLQRRRIERAKELLRKPCRVAETQADRLCRDDRPRSVAIDADASSLLQTWAPVCRLSMGGTGLEPVTPSLSSWCSPN